MLSLFGEPKKGCGEGLLAGVAVPDPALLP